LWGKTVENIRYAKQSSVAALRGSLSAIRHAHVQLNDVADMYATATSLAYKIGLCDVLLVEIADIRSSLERDLRQSRASGPIIIHNA
jgi:hypothetical protein